MSRIDEIKYRNLNWDQIDFTIQSNIDRIFSDQQYLLSRLQIAEEAIKRYENIFNRMITGDVWMTFDEDPVIAYKELAKHALKPIPTANKE